MTKPETPFRPAEWGETYTLAGVEWKPTGQLISGGDKREVAVCAGEIFWLTHSAKPAFGDKETLTEYRERVRIILPSPDFVNAQSQPSCLYPAVCGVGRSKAITPRAVAIASLERAGFRRDGDPSNPQWLTLELPERTTIYLIFEYLDGRGPITPAQINLSMEEAETPALARYAVDCFAVLHAWAAAIRWEATNDNAV